jgi:hypothetical protein
MKAIPAGSFNSASLSGTFALVGALPERLVILRIINLSNVGVGVSYDGTTLNDVVVAGGERELNFITSSLASNEAAALAKGTHIYLNGTAGVGTIYVTGYYQALQQ